MLFDLFKISYGLDYNDFINYVFLLIGISKKKFDFEQNYTQ